VNHAVGEADGGPAHGGGAVSILRRRRRFRKYTLPCKPLHEVQPYV